MLKINISIANCVLILEKNLNFGHSASFLYYFFIILKHQKTLFCNSAQKHFNIFNESEARHIIIFSDFIKLSS